MTQAQEALMECMPTIERHVRYFLRRSRNWLPRLNVDRDELVNEVVIMFLTRYPHWDSSRAKLCTWLDKAIQGTCLDYCDRLARYANRRCELARTIPVESSGYRQTLVREIFDRIEKLTAREQIIIDHVYYGGMNQPEVGKCLGISQGRVSQLRKKAIGKLQDSVRTNGVH